MHLTVLYSQCPGVAVQTGSNSVCEALSPEQESSGPAGTQDLLELLGGLTRTSGASLLHT